MERDIPSQDRPEVARPRGDLALNSREPETSPREREPVVGRNFAYCLSAVERQTMKDVGRFRTIDARDLEQFRYAGDRGKMREDLRSLRNRDLSRAEPFGQASRGTG